MKLSAAKKNIRYKIIEIDESEQIRIDLFSLGVMEGDILTITHFAPFGCPLAILHDRGNFFALRKQQAHCIEVEEFND